MRTGPGAWPYDVGVLAPDQTPHELEQGAVQTAAQVQRAESRQGDDCDAMRGADMEGDRASIALPGQVGDDHGQVPALSSSLRLAASIRSVVSAGGSTRRTTSSTVRQPTAP
jgi:hypothetical protein